MAEISAAAVKSLRERTGLPMMQCKEALKEAGGDAEAAVAILKTQVRGLKEKQVDRETHEGREFIALAPEGSAGAMVEVLCESAPVAGGEDFVAFGEALAQTALQQSGIESPEALLSAKGPKGVPFSETLDDMLNRIREKIVVNRVARLDGLVGGYVHHDGKVGVLFQASGTSANAQVLRDAAMHVAAMTPSVVNPEDVDAGKVDQERKRLTAEAKATGKSDNIIEKIVEGRMKTWYVEEGVLTFQPFAKDDSKSVSQALAEAGLKAKNFIRWKIGG